MHIVMFLASSYMLLEFESKVVQSSLFALQSHMTTDNQAPHYPDAPCSKEVRSGPGNNPGFPVKVDWNARVMECHDPAIR